MFGTATRSGILFLALILVSFQQPGPQALDAEELKLWQDLNQYRKSLRLPPIPLSPALTRVAQAHAADLRDNPPKGACNLHSWSEKSGYSACCYTADHSQADCMWNKPREIAGYPGPGFEIAAYSTYPKPDWLGQWKSSPGHNQVMANLGKWKVQEWKSVGLAIRKPYAVVWFGTVADEAMPKDPR